MRDILVETGTQLRKGNVPSWSAEHSNKLTVKHLLIHVMFSSSKSGDVFCMNKKSMINVQVLLDLPEVFCQYGVFLENHIPYITIKLWHIEEVEWVYKFVFPY